MKKLYFEMTRKEKIAHNTKVLSEWIFGRRSFIMLPMITTKHKRSDGSAIAATRYCVYDSEGEWCPIDLDMLRKELKIESNGTKHLSDELRNSGYRVHDVIGGIIILPSKKFETD